jgi:hypothetical protein
VGKRERGEEGKMESGEEGKRGREEVGWSVYGILCTYYSFDGLIIKLKRSKESGFYEWVKQSFLCRIFRL